MMLLETALDEPCFRPYLRFRTSEFPSEGNRRKGKPMHPESKNSFIPNHRHPARRWLGALILLASSSAFGQATGASPWENAVNALKTSFTGPIATGLSLVAIVVGGLMFAYGEGQSKRVLAGIVFGVRMAIGAVNFMAWLFP
jgi:type IV secretory pathway VirB2 component (pilin)